MKKNKLQNMKYTYYVKEMVFINACKNTSLKIVIYLVVLLISLIVLVIPQIISTGKYEYHRRLTYPTDLKYILFWKHPQRLHRGRLFANKIPEFSSGQTMFIEQKCPNINCYITYDKNLLSHNKDYDAIVFNINDLRTMDVEQINFTRAPEQVYIFRSFESPEKYSMCDHYLDNFFNWTWTYKLNSDLPQPFFNIYNKDNVIVGPKKKMKWIEKMNHTTEFEVKIQYKRKAVAWIVTKCKLKAKHQDFINEFRNELKGYNYTLDILGPCGLQKCGTVVKCQKLVEKRYFFQLLLEEYFSEDYINDQIVTDMEHFTVPIVLGASDYRNFLPPSSYINANAFDMKKLGALVDYLIKNINMYEYFFDWKNHYYFKESPKSQVCDLCKKLNNKNMTTKSYKHFRYWWDPDYKETCHRMRIYKIFNSNI